MIFVGSRSGGHGGHLCVRLEVGLQDKFKKSKDRKRRKNQYKEINVKTGQVDLQKNCRQSSGCHPCPVRIVMQSVRHVLL